MIWMLFVVFLLTRVLFLIRKLYSSIPLPFNITTLMSAVPGCLPLR
jgi:hypothetical protein